MTISNSNHRQVTSGLRRQKWPGQTPTLARALDQPTAWQRLRWQLGVLTLGVTLGLASTAAPGWMTQPLKDATMTALAPGLAAGARLNWTLNLARSRVANLLADARENLLLAQRVETLSQDNQRLRRQLAVLQAHPVVGTNLDGVPATSPPLLDAELVPARLLGLRARQWLAAGTLLDVGDRQRLAAGALALGAAAPSGSDLALPVDLGSQRAQPGQFVLVGLAVCGKIVEVGRHTSWLLPLTSTAYRDEVLILGGNATTDAFEGQTLAAAPRGVLEGAGDGLCRVRLVSATEPVAAGDFVYAAGGEGIWRAPPRYGKVISAKRSPDSAHWQIAVRPDIVRVPAELAVVRIAPHAMRVVQQQPNKERRQ